MKYFLVFPLIVVLTLSGCGGSGSGKLSDGVCESLAALIVDYEEQSRQLDDNSDVLIKLGMSYEQYKTGGCAKKAPLPVSKKLSDAECEALQGFIDYYEEKVRIQTNTQKITGLGDPTRVVELLFEYADKYDNGGCGTSSLLD